MAPNGKPGGPRRKPTLSLETRGLLIVGVLLLLIYLFRYFDLVRRSVHE